MIAEELKPFSVGDWIRPNMNKSMQPFQISRIEGNNKRFYDSNGKYWTDRQWEDIRLSPEILLKNGFEEEHPEKGLFPENSLYCMRLRYLHPYFVYVKKNEERDKRGGIILFKDEYLYDIGSLQIKCVGESVRQFQNFMRFCGFEDIANNFKIK